MNTKKQTKNQETEKATVVSALAGIKPKPSRRAVVDAMTELEIERIRNEVNMSREECGKIAHELCDTVFQDLKSAVKLGNEIKFFGWDIVEDDRCKTVDGLVKVSVIIAKSEEVKRLISMHAKLSKDEPDFRPWDKEWIRSIRRQIEERVPGGSDAAAEAKKAILENPAACAELRDVLDVAMGRKPAIEQLAEGRK